MCGFCCSKCLYSASLSVRFFLTPFDFLKFLLFQIKSQQGVAYKSVVYKKACNIVFQSSKNEKITLPCEFIFVFICYFTGQYCRKSLPKNGSSEWGDDHIRCLSIEGRFKAFAHYASTTHQNL